MIGAVVASKTARGLGPAASGYSVLRRKGRRGARIALHSAMVWACAVVVDTGGAAVSSALMGPLVTKNHASCAVVAVGMARAGRDWTADAVAAARQLVVGNTVRRIGPGRTVMVSAVANKSTGAVGTDGRRIRHRGSPVWTADAAISAGIGVLVNAVRGEATGVLPGTARRKLLHACQCGWRTSGDVPWVRRARRATGATSCREATIDTFLDIAAPMPPILAGDAACSSGANGGAVVIEGTG